jgi:hypothetical protein
MLVFTILTYVVLGALPGIGALLIALGGSALAEALGLTR